MWKQHETAECREINKKGMGKNMKTIEGMYEGKGLKIAIVASRFNEFITSKLIGGAEDCLLRHGVAADEECAVHGQQHDSAQRLDRRL